MKNFFSALLHPVLLGLSGWLALVLLIWLVGPLISIAGHAPLESSTARWMLSAIVLLAAGAGFAYQRWKARASNAKFLDRLFQRPSTQAESAEVQTLRQRLEQAVQVLRTSQLAQQGRGLSRLLGLGRGRYLYQLPWYMFIGAPGSGKTTALINSGLRFPLADPLGSHEIRGIGGTRHCDWWFTDEAVLIDTAGRYTTQDSDQAADREAWLGFLALLRQHRPHQPLNGVILTLSVADLLAQTEGEALRHAEALRARLQELYAQLGVRLPVYVLVTKADLIAGFNEFFATLGQEGRDQVWGCTLALASEPVADLAATLAPKLDALRERLQEQLLGRLQQEDDLARRGAIAGFDQQFAALTRLLLAFLGQVLAPSAYDHPLLVRGVYFSSGTQEGTPIDRLLSSLGGAFGLERAILPPRPGSGKSYFLTRLLREVVFAEQRLGGSNLQWERRRDLVHLGALAGLALLGAGLLAGWTISYLKNSRYVTQVDAATAAAQPVVARAGSLAAQDLPGLLPVLETVARLSTTPERARDAQAPGMGLGLFQGDKLDAATRQAQRTLLRDLLLPRLTQRLENQLRGLDGSDLEFAYEALKAYLMLYQPEHFEAAALKAWIQLDWERERALDADQRAALGRQLDELFASGPISSPVVQDQALVERTRVLLLRLPLSGRIYSRIRREGIGAEFPDFSVDRAAGASGALVFVRRSGQPLSAGIPGLFTRDGYHQGLAPQIERLTQRLAQEESWVLGRSGTATAPTATTAAEVRELYLGDYARAWEALLADLTLAPSSSLAQSVQIARVLSGPDSPLPRLLAAVARETTLVPQQADKTVVDKAGEKLADARQELGRLFGSGDAATPAGSAAPREAIERLVDKRFESIHQLVAGDAKTAPIASVLQLLNELYLQLSATETAIRDKVAPPPGDVGARVKAESARLPEPLRSMLQQLSAASASQSVSATRQNLSSAVGSQLGQFCRLAIEGRYPFVRNSSRDVTREDFARLFAPGGLIDDFFQKHLAALVDTSSKPWSFKKVQEQAVGSSAGLIQFQRAATLREVFFRGSTLRFDFKLVEADPGLGPLTLEIDGQTLSFGPDQPGPQSVQWPGKQGGLTARLKPAAGNAIAAEGPWALFRLIDRARTEPLGAPEKLKATFDLDGQRASFEITAGSVQNPLRLRELTEFRCPQGL